MRSFSHRDVSMMDKVLFMSLKMTISVCFIFKKNRLLLLFCFFELMSYE